MRTGIALGSNLGDRLENLRSGRLAMLAIPGVKAHRASSRIYETDPVDCTPDSKAYLNAVVEVEFEGDPMELLRALQSLESNAGRPAQRAHNSPRPLDLDILYIGALTLHTEVLTIPHPRLHQRRFVLAPLQDIAPDLLLPGFTQNVASLLERLEDPAQAAPVQFSWAP